MIAFSRYPTNMQYQAAAMGSLGALKLTAFNSASLDNSDVEKELSNTSWWLLTTFDMSLHSTSTSQN